MHLGPEQHLELPARRGAGRLEDRATLADHDPLLRLALDAHDDTEREQWLTTARRALVDLIGRYRDRVGQLVAGVGEELLPDELRGNERLRLVGHDVGRVVVR